MAIFTVTSGASSELAVVKITPVVFDCFTLYEYVINANQGNSINITLTGNHYEASYLLNNIETSFNDNVSGVIFNNTLRVKFLLLNSGVTGVYSSATINITNTSTSKYYENYVERTNDGANCYNVDIIPTKTSELLNDGHDGVNPFVDTQDLTAYLPLNGGTMLGTIDMGGTTNDILNANVINADVFETTPNTGDLKWRLYGIASDDHFTFALNSIALPTVYSELYTLHESGIPTDPKDLVTKSYADSLAGSTDADNIIFDPYLTLTSTDVQAAIQELKDEVDLLGAVTIDSVLTNGSTNPVENNAIYDEFQLVAYKGAANVFTASGNTFTNTVVIHDTTDGLEISNNGVENQIDTNSDALHIFSNSNPAGGWTFLIDSGLVGTSSSYLYTPSASVDPEPYSSGWQGSQEVPTKGDVYNKIESLSLGGGSVNISGTPADNQLAVWTNSNTIEGTSGLTYDGSNFQLTGDIGSTGSRITKGWFTDLEVSNSIAGSITGNAATVTSIGNLTGDVTSVNRVTTISSGAVDIPMLSASGTPSSSTFLRGDNTWATPAGSGDVSKVGTPANNQVAVWTGDGTIEGDPNFIWSGTQLQLTGSVRINATGANGLWIQGSASGTSNQSYISLLDSTLATQGYIGFTSNTNNDLSLENEVTGQNILLDGSGGVNGFKFYDGSTERNIYHTGNLNIGDYVEVAGDTMTGQLTITGNELQIEGASPRIDFVETGSSNNWNILVDGDALDIRKNGTSNTIGKFSASGLNVTGAIDATSTLRGSVLIADGDGNNIRSYGSGTGTANINYLSFYESNGSTRQGYLGFGSGSNSNLLLFNDVSGQYIALEGIGGNNAFKFNNGTSTFNVWHSGNDGALSGLDADLLDGYNSSTSGTANTVAVRDASGFITVADSAYSSAWNGDTTVPTKNAIYDKIESIAVGSSPIVYNDAISYSYSGTGVSSSGSGSGTATGYQIGNMYMFTVAVPNLPITTLSTAVSSYTISYTITGFANSVSTPVAVSASFSADLAGVGITHPYCLRSGTSISGAVRLKAYAAYGASPRTLYISGSFAL